MENYTQHFIEQYSEHENDELFNETLIQCLLKGDIVFNNHDKIKQAALKLFEEREMYEICAKLV